MLPVSSGGISTSQPDPDTSTKEESVSSEKRETTGIESSTVPSSLMTPLRSTGTSFVQNELPPDRNKTPPRAPENLAKRLALFSSS